MSENEARQICESDGFVVRKLIEVTDDIYRFACDGNIVVAVMNGQTFIEPT